MQEIKERLSKEYFNDIKPKHLKYFEKKETPEGNFITGFICKKANHFLGSMVITEVVLKDGTKIECERFIQAMPKINYYDRHHDMYCGEEVQYSAYEKLDGTCLILFGLYDNNKNLIEIIPKTRGIPIADSHVIELYNEIDHSSIECFFENYSEENVTLLFELYGALNQHSIFYPKTRIDIRLIGAAVDGIFFSDDELEWLYQQYDFKRPDKIFSLVYYNKTWKIRMLPPGIYAYYLYDGLSEEEVDELIHAEYSTQLDLVQGVKERITKINKSYFEKHGRTFIEGVVIDSFNSTNSHFMFMKVKSSEIEEKCKTENGVPRRFVLKEVHKYFDEYGSKAKEIYREDPNHVVEYVNRNLSEEFSPEAIEMKRTQSRIKNVFLDLLEAKEPPKGLQEICHKIIEEYPNTEISDLMRIFAQEYPEKKRQASSAYSIFESII